MQKCTYVFYLEKSFCTIQNSESKKYSNNKKKVPRNKSEANVALFKILARASEV